MSRIDQALQKANLSIPEPTTTRDDVFVSPWSTEPQPQQPDAAASPFAPVMEPTSVRVKLGGVAPERLVNSPEAHPSFVEQFRRLAGVLHNEQAASATKIVLVTSAAPSDGKSLTALNLALILSESYRRNVLLIDADLRRPSLVNVADVAGPGLSGVLKSRTEQKLSLLQITPTLSLLPAGRPDPDPVGALTSLRMSKILEQAAARFDWVILDSPPIGSAADAPLLGKMVDGIVFVVRAGQTQHANVEKAIEAIGRDRILGVVLNAVEEMPEEYYARYETGLKSTR
jgi:capsular exopolysaccharide synthesis family protein